MRTALPAPPAVMPKDEPTVEAAILEPSDFADLFIAMSSILTANAREIELIKPTHRLSP